MIYINSINFLSEGSRISSSTFHRCYLISNEINKYGYDSKVLSNGRFFRNIPNILKCLQNWKKVLNSKPNFIVLHRSANYIDYHMVMKARNYRIKVIYDYDDAIFLTRYPGKISYYYINRILKNSNSVNAGSHYLKDYANKFNQNVFLLPTPVDHELFSPIKKPRQEDKIIIGWLGGGLGHQIKYLRILKKPLEILSKKYDIKFKMISALSKEARNEFSDVNYEVEFGLDYWVPIEEIPDLISDFDIGVMPLLDNEFERGKCAMKALEYMSMEIPVIASPVGENNYVIKNGFNGFLAANTDEWVKFAEKLILDKELMKIISKNGRLNIEENFSKKVITENFVKLIEA